MRKKILAYVALMAVSFAAFAQEYIEKLNNRYNDSSLIRKIDDGEWLVYSHDTYCNFSRVVDGTTFVNTMSLPSEATSVSDFEIMDGRAYLCGLTDSEFAYMAYFDLQTFPASPVSFIYLYDIDTVIKLEVIPPKLVGNNQLCQVVMTGEKKDSGVIIDAVPTASGWDVYFHAPFILNNQHDFARPYYDDIAVTKGYVVVTYYDCKLFRDLGPKCKNGLLYFSAPATPLTPLSVSTLQARELPYSASAPFLIKAIADDAFVTATKTLNDSIHISLYWGLTMQGTAMIEATNKTLKDLAFDIGEQLCIEILAHNANNNNITFNEITRLTPSLFTSPGTAWEHLRYTDILNSLIYEGATSNRYIMTGCNRFGTHQLYLYRYTAGVYPNECFEYIEIDTEPLDKDLYDIDCSLFYTYKEFLTIVKAPRKYVTQTERICGESLNQ